MEIVKVYQESLPAVRLVGKRYTNADRDESGTFAGHWQQCFAEGWPQAWAQCDSADGTRQDLVGAMHTTGDDGQFEYWIGTLVAPESAAPDGFESVLIPAGNIGVAWLSGNDKNGELYGMEASNLSMAAMAEQGWTFSGNGWFFERYHSERFNQPDAAGNVILDICAYLD